MVRIRPLSLNSHPVTANNGPSRTPWGQSDTSRTRLLVLIQALTTTRPLQPNRLHPFDFDYKTPAGLRCYQARLVPQFSATGEVDSVLVVSTDVTEGKRVKEALRAGEEHLRNVIDRLMDFVSVTTPTGILVEANRHALEVASLKSKDVLGKPFEDTYWWSYSPKVQADLRRAIKCAARGEEVRDDVLIRIGEDRFMPINFMIAPLIDANGKVTHLISSGIDITERKRAEEARARLAAIVESSEDAIISKTLDGVIRSWNAGAERLFGYSHREAVGQPITLIIPPERQDEERGILERLCRGERVEHFETVRVSKDGCRLDISLNDLPGLRRRRPRHRGLRRSPATSLSSGFAESLYGRRPPLTHWVGWSDGSQRRS